MELSRDDFKTILIAEGGWGPVVPEATSHLYQCEQCSTAGHRVFHNVNGERPHIDETELKRRVNAAMWNLD